MITKSYEIRWHSKHPYPDIENWFNTHKIFFHDQSPRIDFYLPLPGQDNLGIKWREGRMEIKKRLGTPEIKQITPRVAGQFEQWVKWSFALADAADAQDLIASPGPLSWLEVRKKRLTMVVAEGVDIKVVLHPEVSDVSSGCQIEYSRIEVDGKTWYTFGLEWFGAKFIQLQEDLLTELIGDTKLNTYASFGYAEFLCHKVYG